MLLDRLACGDPGQWCEFSPKMAALRVCGGTRHDGTTPDPTTESGATEGQVPDDMDTAWVAEAEIEIDQVEAETSTPA
jgi:hypothetical protein